MSTKFCKDCKHFRPDRSYYAFALIPVLGQFFLPLLLRYSRQFAKCAALHNHTGEYFIDGRRDGLLFCSVARQHGACGPDANKFEAR